MPSGSARPDPEPSRHPSHRRERDAAPDTTDGPGDGPEGGAWFAVVLRGYDRGQVDTRLAELDRRIHDETRRADSAESALSASRAHVRRLQEQLDTAITPTTSAMPTVTSGTGDSGFGRRVERVLRAAEQEATELRERAATDAEEIRKRARAEAESRRHRTEEALLSRAATLDQEFTARGTALDEREREAAERLESARGEAVELRAEVRAELDRARAEAAELRREAERAAADRRTGIARDVERLSALRDEVRAELARVRESLVAELDHEPVAAALDDALFGPSGLPDTDRPPSGPLATVDPLGPGDERDSDGGTGEQEGRDGTEGGDQHDADRGRSGSDRDGGDDPGPATGTLLLGPGRLPGRDAGTGPAPRPADEDETTIGQIPPISLASIGVLPFGDLAAGGDNARTRTDGTNGVPRGQRGPTRGPGPGRRSR